MTPSFLSTRGRARGVTVCLLAALSALVGPRLLRAGEAARTTPEDAANRAAAALYEGIRTETLSNGLRVYLKPVANSPVVTTMVAYRVGSSDEELNATGLSHYLER